MTEIKISELPAATQANATDQIETNQSGVSRRLTVAQIKTFAAADSVQKTGDTMTGALVLSTTTALTLPVGTTAQRPAAATGQLRFNTTLGAFEGHNGTAWGSIGGGATGGAGDQSFYLNSTSINNSYTIPSGQNAGTFGPVSVASGAIVTVPNGSTWTIV